MTNTAVFGCATTGNTSFRRCKGALSKCKHFSDSNSVPSTLGSRASGSGSGGNTKISPQQGLSFSLQKRSASFTSSAAAAAGAAASAPKSGGSGSGGYLSGAFQSGSHLSFILESKRSTSAVVRAASGSEAAQAQPPAEDGSSSSDNLDSADTGRNSKGLPSWFPMHDFCLTLPWGLFVALGGVAGFAIAGSTKSLIFGGGFGALLMVLGGLSLKKWKAGGSSTVYTASSLLISTVLSAVMGKKWLAGASFIPSGLIAVGAVFMCISYVHNMATGGNPPRSKNE